jgi:hypothetical protein
MRAGRGIELLLGIPILQIQGASKVTSVILSNQGIKRKALSCIRRHMSTKRYSPEA